MSLGQNARLRQLLELLDRGEVHRARQGCTTQTEWAARLGMTVGQFRAVTKRARELGHAVPRWSTQFGATDTQVGLDDAFDFSEEEPTKPDAEAMTAPLAEKHHQAGDVFQGGMTQPDNIQKPDISDSGPPLPPLAQGFHVRGTSTLVRPDGSIAGQWIKTAANSNAVDPVEVLRAAFGEEMPKYERAPLYTSVADDLLCVYPMGDPHIGMLAWEQDAGDNFDLRICEDNLFAAVDQLVTLAPQAGTALVATVGDTFHSDGLNNATTKGTRVDVDGRTPKMIATGIRVFRRVIDRALRKHGRVIVKIVPGNHDALLSLVLQIALAQYYENEPRVEIDTSPEMFQWLRFGANLIGITHGDKAKADRLMTVMACDRAKDWGETRHRRIYAGHIHHEVIKEMPGVTIEYLRTLAPSDAWHRGQGYRSGHDMKMDVFDREHGHILRHIVGIERVRAA